MAIVGLIVDSVPTLTKASDTRSYMKKGLPSLSPPEVFHVLSTAESDLTESELECTCDRVLAAQQHLVCKHARSVPVSIGMSSSLQPCSEHSDVSDIRSSSSEVMT